MKRLAIIICNFNKQDYIINCIESVLKSSYSNFDIYVVDNASTDKSVEMIESKFAEEINLIINNTNKGGSGGFNTGLRRALQDNYEYVMLLDNDVVIDENAIKESIEYLDKNHDAAVVGSKIFSMDNPNEIQELGANIDFGSYSITPFYKGFINDDNIPDVVECEYVPACSMIVKVEAIKKVGLMPEENFIYWDDIDWGYRFIQNGYKVVALSKSKVWHKMGVKVKNNTFGTYYFWRNRVKFFMTYCNSEHKEKFSKLIFKELFQSIYICNYIGKYSSATTILNAILDAVNGVTGKASDDKIINIEKVDNKFEKLLKNKKRIFITKGNNVKNIRELINEIKQLDDAMNIVLVTSDIQIKRQFLNADIEIEDNVKNVEIGDLIVRMCNHIFDVRNSISKEYVYVDKYFNMIVTEEDIEYVNNYDKAFKLFENILYPIILNGILNYNVYIERKENV